MKPAPVIAAAAANLILTHWNLSVTEDCQIATKGVENTNIFLPGHVWVLRLYRSSTFAQAARETALLRFLHGRGFPVPAVKPDRDGALIVPVRGRPAAVLGFLPGEDLELHPPSAALGAQIGDLLGRMGSALAELTPGVEIPPAHELTNLRETRARLRRCRTTTERDRGCPPRLPPVPWDLVTCSLDACEQAAKGWRTLPRQLIHADISAQNLLARHGQLCGVLDFGDATVSARVAEIAVAICHLAFRGGALSLPLADALWEGWSAVAMAVDAERDALRSLMVARFCKLVVDHSWRELHGAPHPGHHALIAAGIEGLRMITQLPAAWPLPRQPASHAQWTQRVAS